MTISDDVNSIDASPTVAPELPPFKVAVVIGLVALADWLFYRHPPGISLAVFFAVLATASVCANPIHAGWRGLVSAVAILIVGFIPVAARPTLLATMFAFAGVAYTAVATSETGIARTQRLTACGRLVAGTAWRAAADIYRALHVRSEGAAPHWSRLAGWVVPLGLGAIFLVLFSAANPLIGNFFAALDVRAVFGRIAVPRILFWLVFAALVWPFVFMRRGTTRRTAPDRPAMRHSDTPRFAFPAALLNDSVIVRSLLLFNALFLIQTGLDLAYLWGGVALPAGVSYASYAHHGAYPLIVTALLAAAFVIVALQPGSKAERSRSIRLLVFAWIAQNVLLVSSSLLRLDLYVAAYSLSYWRVAAGLWMGLVGIGLVLIVARIALGRSNRWLVAMNIAALTLTLYAVSLANLPALIAAFNVAHSRAIAGTGSPLDLAYLERLGPQAIPALDRYIARAPDGDQSRLAQVRAELLLTWKRRSYQADWRAWNYYDAGLADYLTKRPDRP